MTTELARVVVEIQEHIAHVRLNRAEKRNGLDLAMFEALIRAGDELAANADVRAVVLSGEGKAFCAGLDWMSFMAMGEAGAARLLERDARSPANVAQRACWVWAELPVPVIAAVHGATFGGGLQLALACDIRIAAPDARLSVMEVRYGLIPDMTITQTLFKLVRPDVAADLVYTARTIDAEEARALGLVTRIAQDPVAESITLARTIASQSPDAIRAAKRLLRESPGLPPPEALALETTLQLTLLGTPTQLTAAQKAMTSR